MRPFFTIGVTTYNRKDLLKQLLASILDQTFSDFEVIVGNDYQRETVSADVLGLHDRRIKFVNHPVNLGEIGNMNSLLSKSNGRYFTWQFDDDLYSPHFLESVHSAIVTSNSSQCVYSSYGHVYGSSAVNISKKIISQKRLLSGREFLRGSLSGKLKVMGCCGVFETECLRSLGGVQDLCGHSIGAHSEHMLLVRAGLLRRVIYLSQPLVFFRWHDGSWSGENGEVDLYKRAGENMILESLDVLQSQELRDDFGVNLSSLLSLSLDTVVGRLISRDGYLDENELMDYVSRIKHRLGLIGDRDLRQTALDRLDIVAGKMRLWRITKAMFRSKAPRSIVRCAHAIRALVSQYK